MTKDGWKQLTRPIHMEVWDRVSWNHISKKWEPDAYFGTLRCVGYTDHAEPTCKVLDWKAYEARTEAYCQAIRDEVAESRARRAGV